MYMSNLPKNKLQTKYFTIPNLLSMFRIALIPICVWMYCVERNSILTATILLLSWFTDMIDGFIARKFNMISEFGKILDPVADKLTQSAMLFCLLFNFHAMLYLFLFMVIKETAMAITGYIVIKKTNTVYGANWHGKIATGALYTILFIHILWINIPLYLSTTLILLCAGLMLLSLVLYITLNINILKQHIKEDF